ncbi:MAG: 4a-hydroxytetrahydrobiopterin dehydratase, partial [Acidimicrobiia bacterium]
SMATPLDAEQRSQFASAHAAWSRDGEKITRTFQFVDFAEAMGFVTRVALAAEAVDHHPDIDIRWNKVTLTLSTHEAKALTERDTELAAKIDGFVG